MNSFLEMIEDIAGYEMKVVGKITDEERQEIEAAEAELEAIKEEARLALQPYKEKMAFLEKKAERLLKNLGQRLNLPPWTKIEVRKDTGEVSALVKEED